MADEDRMFIGGEWVGSESGAVFEATSPSSGEVIGTVPEGTRADAQRAIAAAGEAGQGGGGGAEGGEVISYVEMAAEDATRLDGVIPPSVDRSKRVLLQRVPRGVVAAISPWNWPYTMPAEIVAPALAYGHAVGWGPAPTTSGGAGEP